MADIAITLSHEQWTIVERALERAKQAYADDAHDFSEEREEILARHFRDMCINLAIVSADLGVQIKGAL